MKIEQQRIACAEIDGMAACTKCGEEKPLSSFSPSKSGKKNGRKSRCKSCSAHDYKLYSQTKHGRAVISEYRKSDNRKSSLASHKNKYPEKIRAKTAINNAVRDGRLTRPAECSECGCVGKIEAHHGSYEEEHWLDVVWLCTSCHNKTHREGNHDNKK